MNLRALTVLCSKYNIISSRKIPFKKLNLTPRILHTVKIFYKIGIIKNFVILENPNSKKYIMITNSFYKNSPICSYIRQVSTPSKKFFITYKALKILHKSLKSSSMLISTPKGLITHKEAIKLKTGGIIFCFFI